MGWGLAPGFVCFCVFCVFFNLTGKKLKHNMALGVSVFLGAHHFPGSAPPHPHHGSRQRAWETRGGGSRALRAASHGLSDLLTHWA